MGDTDASVSHQYRSEDIVAPRTVAGSKELGSLIRVRRVELGLSIEQAAASAGLGSETWRRYENGSSIRQDKLRVVRRALKWRTLPVVGSGSTTGGQDPSPDIWELAERSSAYAPNLVEGYGEEAARVFAVGCDIIGDQIKDDLEQLRSMRRWSHVGEVPASWLDDQLPPRWLMRYDYDFLFRLRATVEALRLRAVHPDYDGIPHFTRCVADDLALHLVMEQGTAAFEDTDHSVDQHDVGEWEYEMNGEDDEVMTLLYSEWFDSSPDQKWHFDRWFDHTYYGLDGATVEKTNGGTSLRS
jgi:transcriptional regulator with XRE-family HTH domain